MELYRINRTGGVKRLTHLLEEYESVTIRGYSWSPDGRKIAVGLMTEPDNLPLYGIEPRVYMRATIYNRVAILDVTTGVVTNLCIPVENEGLSISQWSPDSRFLLVNHVTEYDSLGKARDTVLIDLQQGSAATIAKQTVPIGWMLENQE
jgi:Tol biopolymer transport system component